MIRPTSKHTEDLAVDTTIALLPRCPLPMITNPTPATVLLAWDYYNALVDENSNIAFRARSLLSYARNEEHNRVLSENHESKLRILHQLIFTHPDNLFDCSNLASDSTSLQLYDLAQNAKATINVYTRIWPDLQFAFLTNDDSIDLINQTDPDLTPYFESVPGMYKADL